MKKLLLLSLLTLFSCNKEQSVNEEPKTKIITELKTAEKTEKTVAKTDAVLKEEPKTQKVTNAVFKWDSEVCENSGVYNSEIYTEEKLKNTIELVKTTGSVALNTSAIVFSKDDIKKLSLDELNKEYNTERAKLVKTTLVDGDFWKKYKEDRIKMLDDEYQLKKITIEAFSNPKVLLDNRFTEKCKEFALALNSETDAPLFDAWKKIVDENMKTNGSPESLLKTYNEQRKSEDSLLFAKVEVMTFGWWNCANDQLVQIYSDGKDLEQFEKIFSKIDRVCDEP
ncbi:hypothetical protein JXR93_04980 [bacterium]|nr:hypothetical protein [bacterium]